MEKELTTYQKIEVLGRGHHRCGGFSFFPKGWIDIDVSHDGDFCFVFWTKFKDRTPTGTAVSISYDAVSGEILYVFEQVLGMHMVKEPAKKNRLIQYMESKIDEAYKFKTQII